MNTPCKETNYAPDKDGYSLMDVNKEHTRVHRYAYVLANNLTLKDIKGKLVRHLCNNPRCINPEHLALGTNQDNTNDKIAAGRVPKGTKHWNAKLNDSDILAIRASREQLKVLSVRYEVSVSMISMIRNRRVWKHLK